jgi:hypothetical protein
VPLGVVWYSVNADELLPRFWFVFERVFGRNGLLVWDVGDRYSDVFDVADDIICIGTCCCNELVNWSDKWEVSSDELFV